MSTRRTDSGHYQKTQYFQNDRLKSSFSGIEVWASKSSAHSANHCATQLVLCESDFNLLQIQYNNAYIFIFYNLLKFVDDPVTIPKNDDEPMRYITALSISNAIFKQSIHLLYCDKIIVYVVRSLCCYVMKFYYIFMVILFVFTIGL